MASLFGFAPAESMAGLVRTLDPVGGRGAVYELDMLVLLMTLLACVHAARTSQWPLVFSGLGLGLLVEHASLRLGGTHCHQSGMVDISECSSANSVVYYLPWVYGCVTISRRLMDDRSWAHPLVCGLCFFGMCGIYESQGPLMGWWLWPDTDMVVKAGSEVRQFGVMATDGRGLVASKHAFDALHTRVYGVPALAPYFHFAFGWGIATAFKLFSYRPSWRVALLCVLGGPAIAMVWDLPIRVLRVLVGADQAAAAQFLMCGSMAAVWLLGPALKRGQTPDPLLFAIVLPNQSYFVYNALFGRGADVLPPPLKLFVTGVAIAATAAYGRGAGMWAATEEAPSVAEAVKGTPRKRAAAKGVLKAKYSL